jgi:hypothetical protein
MGETRKRVRLCKRHRDENEGDIKVMGIKNRKAMDRNNQACRKTVLEAKIYNRQYYLRKNVKYWHIYCSLTF